jgi:hypothetical protein
MVSHPMTTTFLRPPPMKTPHDRHFSPWNFKLLFLSVMHSFGGGIRSCKRCK